MLAVILSVTEDGMLTDAREYAELLLADIPHKLSVSPLNEGLSSIPAALSAVGRHEGR